MTKDEALRLALEVLADLGMKHYENTGEVLYKNTYTAIKAALEAKDEPVAGQPLPCPFCGHVGLNFADGETYRWGVASCGGCGASCGDIRREYPDLGEWHTEAIAEWNRRSPAPQRTWVGLTNKDWNRSKHNYDFQKGVDWAESILKEKNT